VFVDDLEHSGTYYPIKRIAYFDLDNLPSDEEFLSLVDKSAYPKEVS
jgi:hypothetical protein